MISSDEQLYQARADIQTRWRFPESHKRGCGPVGRESLAGAVSSLSPVSVYLAGAGPCQGQEVDDGYESTA
jgi:hypothetical protein